MFEGLKKALSAFAEKVVHKELTERDLNSILFEFELNLIAADIAPQVAQEIVEKVKKNLIGAKVRRFSSKKDIVFNILINELRAILDIPPLGLLSMISRRHEMNKNDSQWRPFIIVFLGPNGCGKTTTIAKLAYLIKKNDLSVVLAAADTFRAGAIEQLELHAKRIGVRVIKRQYGADPASVAVDAIQHAIAKKIDAVLIDTAGRLATAQDLIDEMRKIVRVSSPDIKCLVVDALMGNDLANQAQLFMEGVGVDCSILTKVDADVKGGAAITLIYTTRKPIEFIGVGQGYEDLKEFDAEWFLKKIVD